MTDRLWILYPGQTGSHGGRAEAESAEEAFEAIVAAHVAGGTDEEAIRAAAGPSDLVEASDEEILDTRQGMG